MISDVGSKYKVFDIIASRRAGNPVISSVIEGILNISGVEVRDAVRELRRSGEPIVAVSNGYFMASTPEEVNLIVHDFERRIGSLSKTLSEIKRKAYERFKGQGRFCFAPIGSGIQGAPKGETAAICGHSEKEGKGGHVFVLQNNSPEDLEGQDRRQCEDGTLDSLLQP